MSDPLVLEKILRQSLRKSLGTHVGVGVTDPQHPAPPLWPAEEPATIRMIDKRRREFAAGRAAARAAMADLGLSPAAIPMNPDRAPRWPDGLCGSLSHCATAAVAIVARCEDTPSLGIDIEEDTDLPPDLWPDILTAREHDWLMAQVPSSRGHHAKSIFTAKEAVHKLHYPLSGQVLGFDDVTITLAPHSFWTQLPIGVPGLPEMIYGHIFRAENLLITAITGTQKPAQQAGTMREYKASLT
ncbi:MAG: 4'-phosphopantetheinyl transferase superfamily protein [Roseobacter sp.]